MEGGRWIDGGGILCVHNTTEEEDTMHPRIPPYVGILHPRLVTWGDMVGCVGEGRWRDMAEIL